MPDLTLLPRAEEDTKEPATRRRCFLFHDWGAPFQGEASALTKAILLAALKRLPPGAVVRDSVTPWFKTCKRCGQTEQC